MRKSPFANALRRAEGTIAARIGGRKAWDSVTLKETALSAMAGDAPSTVNMGPDEWDAIHEAFNIIQKRTTAQHKCEASVR